jgi:hypothetical protein
MGAIPDSNREMAVHAVDTLTDLIGDFGGGTNLFRYWLQQENLPASIMVNVQKICVSHLVLALYKFVEFHRRFHALIPSEHRQSCKALVRNIRQKGVVEFRNKCVGHIWDKDRNRPLINSEIMTRLDLLTNGDMRCFLNWINSLVSNEYPSTVISIVETLRDSLMSQYFISPDEFLSR